MAKAEIVDFPVAHLPDRYGKARSAIYTQMDKLGIVPTKQGNKAFILDSQLELLDELNNFLNEDTSRNIDDFIREVQPKTPALSATRQTGQLTGQLTRQSAELSYQGLDEVFDIGKTITVLRERFELLERCSEQGWLLSTSDLAELIGITPESLVKEGEIFRWGFTFTKCPVKTGRQVCWSVRSPSQK
ncbi:hypothetical protein [Allocoleopsis franciscana]|uniref:Uncharacterized protein n=1 Tax=Allocoleopsis franciscana PCC 7113 TaxID=1173027 RepID=K9WR54_9CYAN|nr:hypothetical protein [Allocoleopsis franciscana]AFZ22264.1 hypothetical protein Mic7113_6701 [Allocoleopsis franciscana PCC 7113]